MTGATGVPASGTVTIVPPGDKSISHRALLLGVLGRGVSRVRGLLDAADVRATARVLIGLGAQVPERWDGDVALEGPARLGSAGERPLDCGNSGTTSRLSAGLIAGAGVEAVLDGDASLRRRPMDRVVYPLQAMGARIDYLEEGGRLPIRLRSRATGSLRALVHRPEVASAQVKSSLLLAGLASGVAVEVVEPGRSRDHTERLLAAMQVPVQFGPEGEGARVRLEEGARALLEPLDLEVPSDPSSAAFLVAAALLGGRSLRVEGVGLNPTRTGWISVLRRMGATLRIVEGEPSGGEPVGTLTVEPSELGAFEITGREVPRLLDEIPVLAVLAARAEGTSVVRGAEELRVKESDRLALLASNLERIGVRCRELEDGLEIEGTDAALEGSATTAGDHRIAMAFGALRTDPDARVEVDDPGCVAVSYPGFWDDLARLHGSEAEA